MQTARSIVPVAWALACGPLVFGLLHLPGAAWCAMLGYHAGCLAAVRIAGGAGPRGGASSRQALGIAALSAAVVFASGTLADRAGLTPLGQIPLWARWGLRPPADLAWLAWYVLVNPWVEEGFWRGALLAAPLRAKLGRHACRALAILAFGGHHVAVLGASLGWVWGALLVLPVVAAAAIWTALRERRGGLAPAVASHWGADLALALLYLWRWRA